VDPAKAAVDPDKAAADPAKAAAASLAARVKVAHQASRAAPAKAGLPVSPALPVRRTSPACLDNLIRPVNPAHLVGNIRTRSTKIQAPTQAHRQVKAALLRSSLLPSCETGGPYGSAGFFVFASSS
jgi:hypothetical protein